MVGGNVRGYKREIKKEEDEEVEEMVGSYSKRCKRSTPNSNPEIPVQDIYGAASRLVCKEWNRITRTKKFTLKHLEQASYGFLYMDESKKTVFVCARKDGRGIETCELKNCNNLLLNSVISCNGLTLRFECPPCNVVSTVNYWVENVLTGQALSLPPVRNCYPCNPMASGIGYAAASKTYKVVVPYCLEKKEGVSVFTVGVDVSWRSVCVDNLSPLGMKMLVHGCSTGTEGFVHWASWSRRQAPFGCAVLSLNIETEVIKETSPPVEIKTTNYRFLSTGKYLSFFVMRTKLVWEVFEMKPDTLEWTQLPDMCLELEGLPDDVDIVPSCWLKYPEVVCLRVGCDLLFYSFITCKIGAEKLSTFNSYVVTKLHKNSLQDWTTR